MLGLDTLGISNPEINRPHQANGYYQPQQEPNPLPPPGFGHCNIPLIPINPLDTDGGPYNHYNEHGVDNNAYDKCSWPMDARYLIYPSGSPGAAATNGEGTNANMPSLPSNIVSDMHTMENGVAFRDAPPHSDGGFSGFSNDRFSWERGEGLDGVLGSFEMAAPETLDPRVIRPPGGIMHREVNPPRDAVFDPIPPGGFEAPANGPVHVSSDGRVLWDHKDSRQRADHADHVFERTALEPEDYEYSVEDVELRDGVNGTDGEYVHVLHKGALRNPIDIQILSVSTVQAQPVISSHNRRLVITECLPYILGVLHVLSRDAVLHVLSPDAVLHPRHLRLVPDWEHILRVLEAYVLL